MNFHWTQPALLLIAMTVLFEATTSLSYGTVKSQTVIDVGAKKQLFIDRLFIESSRGVRLTMNPPYQSGELLVTNDQPWENQKGAYICLYANVLKDKDRIRLWYWLIFDKILPGGNKVKAIANCSFICYAESKDGIHFTKPELNLHELNGSRANNVVMSQLSDPNFYSGGSVWIDPKAPPEQRYKSQGKNRRGRLSLYCSPDGLRWKRLRSYSIGACDTQNVVFWDESIGRYVIYTRDKGAHKTPGKYRFVRRMESDDLVHWDNKTTVMKADQADLTRYQTPTPQPPVDYYGAGVFKYPHADRAYIMLAQAFWHWYPRAGMERLGPNTMDVQLAVSRDGKKFKRAGGRKPFLRLGPEGSFYSRMVWALPDPVRVGDELWIYFVGTNRDHAGYIDRAAEGRLLSGVGRAVMRLDGFISADADYTGGEITTPPIKFSGKNLQLNLDTSAGGSVLVELLDAKGQSIKGYTQAEATPLCGNSVRMPVTWGRRRNVSELAGKPIKIRFIMRDCKLYAFQFTN